jgi:hypothetical protein
MWSPEALAQRRAQSLQQSERARTWWTAERRAVARGVTRRRHLRLRAEAEAETNGWPSCAWRPHD